MNPGLTNPENPRLRPMPSARAARPGEEGYMLLAVIILLALLMISMSVALPQISKEIQRDREIETMHRGKQYIRAIKMYYKKYSAYPPNMEALTKPSGPGGLRFLRKKYIDPTTGKDEWKPIRFGQNKAPTAMGFFGQAIGGSTVAGTGPSGGNGLTGVSAGGTSAFGSNGGNSLFGAAGSGIAPTAPPTAGSTDSSGGTSASGGTDSSASSAAGPGTGLTGQTFGGGGIIGFSPTSPKQSILVYKKKNHYNEWEFTYDPLAEQMMQGGNTGTIGQPASSTTTPIGGSPGASNNPGFGPTTGGNSSGGIAPTPPASQ
jgi:type II secretory pathway pseudopilin PulG